MMLRFLSFVLVTLITLGISIHHVCGQKPIKICSFNIQIFGVTKVNKPLILTEIIRIIKEYDLIFIMEIRDATDKSITQLLHVLNNNSKDKYSYVISNRLGRSTSTEQYAYLYKDSLLKVTDSYHYDDGDEEEGTDTFEREPFVVRFSATTAAVKDFFMIGIHATPDTVETTNEVAALIDVYNDASQRWKIEDAILTGDMNADCSYMSKTRKKSNKLFNDPKFISLISDDIDTTTKDTDCAYDRVFVTGKNMVAHVKSAVVFNYQKEHNLTDKTTTEISDHYPVLFTIY